MNLKPSGSYLIDYDLSAENQAHVLRNTSAESSKFNNPSINWINVKALDLKFMSYSLTSNCFFFKFIYLLIYLCEGLDKRQYKQQ